MTNYSFWALRFSNRSMSELFQKLNLNLIYIFKKLVFICKLEHSHVGTVNCVQLSEPQCHFQAKGNWLGWLARIKALPYSGRCRTTRVHLNGCQQKENFLSKLKCPAGEKLYREVKTPAALQITLLDLLKLFSQYLESSPQQTFSLFMGVRRRWSCARDFNPKVWKVF